MVKYEAFQEGVALFEVLVLGAFESALFHQLVLCSVLDAEEILVDLVQELIAQAVEDALHVPRRVSQKFILVLGLGGFCGWWTRVLARRRRRRDALDPRGHVSRVDPRSHLS